MTTTIATITKISDAAVGAIIAAEIGNSFDHRYGPAERNVGVVVGFYDSMIGKPGPGRQQVVVATKTPEGKIRISSAGKLQEDWYADEEMVPAYITDDLPLESPVAESHYLKAIGQTIESVAALASALPNGDWDCNPNSHIGRR